MSTFSSLLCFTLFGHHSAHLIQRFQLRLRKFHVIPHRHICTAFHGARYGEGCQREQTNKCPNP